MKQFKIILLLTLTLGLSSCGDSGSGGGTPISARASTPQPYGGEHLTPCNTCSNMVLGGSTLLPMAYGITPDSSLSTNIQIFGSITSYCMQPIDKQILCATGPATLSGIIQIHQDNLICGLPRGEYQLLPLTPSQIGSAMLMGGQYYFMGPNGYRVKLTLQQAILSNPQGLSSNSNTNRVNISATLNYEGYGACGFINTY